ncbi:MAG: hypothetical protein R2762_31180, partial [Bryobacteraceae bacterium]
MPVLPEDLRKFATLDFAIRMGAFGVTTALSLGAAYFGQDKTLSAGILAAAATAGNVFANLATDAFKGCVEQVRAAPDRNFYQEDALRKALQQALAGLRTDLYAARWFDPWHKHLDKGGEENLRRLFGTLTHTQIHALALDPSGWWKLAAKSLVTWAAAEHNAWEEKPLPAALSALLEKELPRRLQAEYRHQLQITPEAFRGHALDHFEASAANDRTIISLLRRERLPAL